MLKPYVQLVNGRYEVDTPRKADHGILGDNYFLAEKRLFYNLEKYKRDNLGLLRKYHDILKEQLSDGTLKIVTADMMPKVGETLYAPSIGGQRRQRNNEGSYCVRLFFKDERDGILK